MARNKAILPNVINDFDNVIVQFKCVPWEPEYEDFDIDVEVLKAVNRYEFILGTPFYVQFIDPEGERVLAIQKYLVNSVKESIHTSEIDYYRTMQKNVVVRTCVVLEPIKFLVDDYLPSKKRPRLGKKVDVLELEQMNTSDLQSLAKRTLGKGFPVSTPKEEMVEKLKAAM